MRASTKLRRLIEGDDVIMARWSGGFYGRWRNCRGGCAG